MNRRELLKGVWLAPLLLWSGVKGQILSMGVTDPTKWSDLPVLKSRHTVRWLASISTQGYYVSGTEMETTAGEAVGRVFRADEIGETFKPLKVYLDGREVQDWTTAMYASVSPNLAIEGWCEMFTCVAGDGSILLNDDGELVTEIRRGMVCWEPYIQEGDKVYCKGEDLLVAVLRPGMMCWEPYSKGGDYDLLETIEISPDS